MFRRAACASSLLGSLSLAAAGVVSAAPVPFPSSGGGTGSAYDVIINADTTYAGAQSAAASAGGHLVSITSASEQSFIESLLINTGAPTGSYWMALERVSADAFKWSTGEPFSYENFAQGEPNNFLGNELVGQVYWSEDAASQFGFRRGEWNDAPVDGYGEADQPDLARAGFVIEIEDVASGPGDGDGGGGGGGGGEPGPNPIPIPAAVFTAPLAMLVAGLVARRRRLRAQ